MLPNRHKLNLAALVVSFILMVIFVRSDSTGTQVLCLLVMTAIALAFGWHLVASIAVRTCRWWSRCSTPTRAGRQRRRALC
ncbi:NAD(P) transhydrogenase subunit beta [Klebsiella pneumoniae]|uniref:NAD(P) transhydrogenase subunit beta n=1 Tax=Klebsiella pneumoniae TaxID=573 RepID=A0A377V4L0_KLEPN|nr:NAD(P) transhydrogenase subunit beta [Klebsiella pneumoniae]